MFNLQKALLDLNGRELDFDELRKELEQIRARNLSNLSPEVGVRELFLIAQQNHWIQEYPSGKLRIQLPAA